MGRKACCHKISFMFRHSLQVVNPTNEKKKRGLATMAQPGEVENSLILRKHPLMLQSNNLGTINLPEMFNPNSKMQKHFRQM